MQQLLWIETLLKFAAGLVLVLIPGSALGLLGLPLASSHFWPRLLGAVLIGMAGAFYLKGSVPGSTGLGLGGAVIINLAAVVTLTTMLVLDAGPQTARGRAIAWALVVLLVWLSVMELANL